MPWFCAANAAGRSTRHFINEGRWQLLLSEPAKGDYVLIQFGHKVAQLFVRELKRQQHVLASYVYREQL